MNLIDVLIHIEYADSKKEAEAIVDEMRERVYAGEDPEAVLYEYGLEPDYVFDII